MNMTMSQKNAKLGKYGGNRSAGKIGQKKLAKFFLSVCVKLKVICNITALLRKTTLGLSANWIGE